MYVLYIRYGTQYRPPPSTISFCPIWCTYSRSTLDSTMAPRKIPEFNVGNFRFWRETLIYILCECRYDFWISEIITIYKIVIFRRIFAAYLVQWTRLRYCYIHARVRYPDCCRFFSTDLQNEERCSANLNRRCPAKICFSPTHRQG